MCPGFETQWPWWWKHLIDLQSFGNGFLRRATSILQSRWSQPERSQLWRVHAFFPSTPATVSAAFWQLLVFFTRLFGQTMLRMQFMKSIPHHLHYLRSKISQDSECTFALDPKRSSRHPARYLSAMSSSVSTTNHLRVWRIQKWFDLLGISSFDVRIDCSYVSSGTWPLSAAPDIFLQVSQSSACVRRDLKLKPMIQWYCSYPVGMRQVSAPTLYLHWESMQSQWGQRIL